MRCGQSVKFAGTVKMVPAVAGAAPAVLEKNIAANKFIGSWCLLNRAPAFFSVCTVSRDVI